MERPSKGLLDKIDDFYDDLIDDGLISKDKRPAPRRRSRSRSRDSRRGRSRSRSRSRDRRSPNSDRFKGGFKGKGDFKGGSSLDKIEMMKEMMKGMMARKGGGTDFGKSLGKGKDFGGGGNAAAQQVIQAAKLITAMQNKGGKNW